MSRPDAGPRSSHSKAERSVSPVGAPSSLAPYLRGESRGCPLSVHTPGTRRALDFIADPDRTEETQLTTTGAISEFREAMRIDPFLTDSSLASIGQTLLRQNKQAEAETLFREALSANPALPHARGNLGAILYKQGKHDEAIRHLQMALQIDPNLILVHVNLATIFAKQDNFPEAIRHYREFLRIKPDDLPRRYSLASLLLRAGQIRESVDEHRQVLAQQGGHLPTLVSLARIFAACGDPKFRDGNEAVCIMERLCSRAGAENPQLLSVLAMAYAETGQFDKAVTTAEKALSLAKVNVLGKLVSQLQRELSFYRQTKPYRDPGKR